MAFIVYVQNTETGKVEEVGAYDLPPLIVAQDGSSFSSVKLYGSGQFHKVDN